MTNENEAYQIQPAIDAEMERYYRRAILPAVRRSINEFKGEMGSWGKDRRVTYLYYRFLRINARLASLEEAYLESHRRGEPYVNRALLLDSIKGCRKALLQGWREIRHHIFAIVGGQQDNSSLPDSEIERARQYPIEQLVDVGYNGMARCVSHEDKTPSMDTRNGFAYCYACGFSGDAIEVYRKLHGAGFVEAVRALQ